MSSIEMDRYEQKRLDLIRKYEGFDPNAYQLDGENFHTIGYGSTEYQDGSSIGSNDSITPQAAQELLDHHIKRAISNVSKLEGYQQLTPNAQAAIGSFAYNAGPNFINDDEGYGTINSAIRAGDPQGVADALPLYTNGGLAGLVRRREEEAALAIKPAMDPVDSTLANDLTRKFGTDAVLDGKPVKWGGKDYGWQSPESFGSITPPKPETADQNPSLYNLFGILK
jgi:GH24 family phage-related lysozyme (muramidase)